MGLDSSQLQQVLLKAFPNQIELERIVQSELGENLAEIAGGTNLKQIISNLIEWAEEHGKLEKLTTAALKKSAERPGLRSSDIFVGRQREIAQIEHALADPDINIVTISGVGGIGKTTLAQLIAARQQESDQFPGGIIWVDCTLYDSLPSILASIVEHFGSDSATISSSALRNQVIFYLRSAPILLILDNYEIVARNDEILSFVGRLPKGTKALIISRDRVKIHAPEISINLPGLTQEEALELLQKSLNPKRWATADQKDLQELLRQIGGHPLAMKIVVNLLEKDLPPPQILDQLSENIISTDKTLEDFLRQWNLSLSNNERQILEALSVFTHPVELEAITAVSGIRIRQGEALIKSLTESAVLQVIDGQYLLHELVRGYLYSRIPPDRLSLLEQRMVQYFLAYARKFQIDFDRIDLEWPNIQHSIETADKNKLWTEFIAFILTLGQFLSSRGYESEYLKWLYQAIEVSTGLNDKITQAALLHNLGVRLQQNGDMSAALEAYKSSLQKEVEIQDRLGQARTLAQLGTVYSQMGQLDRAEQNYRQALEISSTLDDRLVVSQLLGDLGNLSLGRGNPEEAIRYFEQALIIKQAIKDRLGEITILERLGVSYQRSYSRSGDLANLEQAIDLYRQAIVLSREIGDRRTEVDIFARLGVAIQQRYYQTGDLTNLEQAIDLYEQVLALSRELGDRQTMVNLLANLGTAYSDLPSGDRGENLRRAIDLYEQALALSRELGDHQTTVSLLANLGTAYSDLPSGDRGENLRWAIDLYEQALALSRELGDRQTTVSLLADLGTAYSDLPSGDRGENLRRAIDLYEEVLETLTPEAAPLQYARIQNNLGNIYANSLTQIKDRSVNLERAIAHYQASLKIYTRVTAPLDWATIENNLGAAYYRLLDGDRSENLKQAIASFQNALQVFTQEEFPGDWLRAITNLSTAYAEVGNWPEAKQQATQALQALRSAASDPESLEVFTPWYQQLGDLAIQNQDLEFAAQIFAGAAHRFELQGTNIPDIIQKRLIELRELLGDERFVITCAEAQGALTPLLAQILQDARQAMSEENFKQAEEKLSSALEILSQAEETKDVLLQQAAIFYMRGFCRRQQAQWPEALKDQEESFHLFEKVHDFIGEARAFLEMGYLLEVMNNYDDARLHYMDAYQLYRRAGSKRGMALASESLGRLELRVHLFLQAVEDLEEARTLYISLGESTKAAALDSDLKDAQTSLDSRISAEK